MKQVLLLFSVFILLSNDGKAENFNVAISGFSYSPATLTVNVGDVVNIEASAFHPLVQVNQATWDANGNTLLSGGFSSSANFALTITAAMAGTAIYYACSNHAISGMKGQINVNVISGTTESRAYDFNFKVFPNPVSTDAWLNISTKKSEKISFSLYDLKGRFVTQFADITIQAGDITVPFDVPPLQKGLYILQMRTSQGLIRKQIVIQ